MTRSIQANAKVSLASDIVKSFPAHFANAVINYANVSLCVFLAVLLLKLNIPSGIKLHRNVTPNI